MDWDELESIMWNYFQMLPEPKISFEAWWYGDNGVRETLLTYHIDKKPEPSAHIEREVITRPIWARRGR